MANGNFRILVGGGADPFASLAAQRQYYDQLNTNTATGDLARLAASQQAANNWFVQAAALREQAIERQRRAEQEATNLSLGLLSQAQTRADEERRWLGYNALEREKLGIQRDKWQRDLDLYNLDERRQRENVRRWGTFAAPQFEQARKAHSQALYDYNDALREANVLPERLALSLPPGLWNDKTQRFEFPPKTDPKLLADTALAASMNAANQRIRDAESKVQQLRSVVEMAAGRLATFQNPANKEIVPGEEGGQAVYYSPRTDETYRPPPNPVLGPPPPVPVPVRGVTPSQSPLGVTRPMTGTLTSTLGRVRVIAPDGTRGTVAADEVDLARRMGYTVVE